MTAAGGATIHRDLAYAVRWHNGADSPESRLIGGPIQENRSAAADKLAVEFFAGYLTPAKGE